MIASHIIEYGSNANGSYTKFADGTLLCVAKTVFTDINTTRVGSTPFYRSPAKQVIFPIQFRTVLAGGVLDSTWDTLCFIWNVTQIIDGSTFYVFTTEAHSGGSFNCSVFAIGRWQ